jgi:hypothetical protein
MPKSRWRSVRLAASLISATMCTLLIALRARSCEQYDTWEGRRFYAGSSFGLIALVGSTEVTADPRGYESDFLRPSHYVYFGDDNRFGFSARASATWLMVVVPHWFPAICFAAVALIAWPHWASRRFSLRASLIAMTLIAVWTALVVFSSKLGRRLYCGTWAFY